MNRFEHLESRWHLAAGDIDRSFGVNGRIVGGATLAEESPFTDITAVATLPAADGKTIIVSSAVVPRDEDYGPYYATVLLNRVLPDGGLDLSFGRAGYVLAGIGDDHYVTARAAAVDSQGRVVVLAEIGRPEDEYSYYYRRVDLAVLRFTPDGRDDLSFGGGDGFTVLSLGGAVDPNLPLQLATKDGDRVVVAANRAVRPDDRPLTAVAQLRANGSPDPRFHDDGVLHLRLPPHEITSAMAIDATGRTLLTTDDRRSDSIGVICLTPRGRRDATFSGDGVERISLAADRRHGVTDLVTMPDGRILVAGGFDDADDSRGDTFILRLRGDGTRDPRFGGGDGAIVAADLGIAPTRFDQLIPNADGRLLVITKRPLYYSSDAAMMTLRANGTLQRRVALQDEINGNADALLLSDGRLLIAGGQSVTRVTTAGRVDPSYRETVYALMAIETDRAIDTKGRLIRLGGESGMLASAILPDGRSDVTFGAGGFAFLGLGGGISAGFPQLDLHGDGRAVVLTTGTEDDSDGRAAIMGVLDANGQLDLRFPTPYDYGNPAPQETGSGEAHVSPDGWTAISWYDYTYSAYYLNMYATDGRLGLQFSSGFDYSQDELVPNRRFKIDRAVPINDGRGGFYISGAVEEYPGENPTEGIPALRRMLPDRRNDLTFAGDGVKENFKGIPIAAQPDGALLYALPGKNGLFRLRSDGSADRNFGSGGVAGSGFDQFSVDSAGHIIAWRQIVGGSADGDVQVMRLTRSGKTDSTFGGGDGLVTIDTRMSSTGATSNVLVTPGDVLVVTALGPHSAETKWFATRLIG